MRAVSQSAFPAPAAKQAQVEHPADKDSPLRPAAAEILSVRSAGKSGRRHPQECHDLDRTRLAECHPGDLIQARRERADARRRLWFPRRTCAWFARRFKL